MKKAIHSELTSETLANIVIERYKAVPDEAKQTNNSDLATLWDEYKDQVQNGDYDSNELYEDLLKGMAIDAIDDLSAEEFGELVKNES